MSKTVPAPPLFVVHEDLSFEDALANLSSLLRCATTAANDMAEGLTGTQRDKALTTAHLIDLASTLSNRALDCLQPQL